MIRKMYIIILCLIGMHGIGQAAEHSLISYVPGKPLVIFSAEDLKGNAERLKSHQAVQEHAKSRDRERYDDSKLTLKLGDRIAAFGDFVGHKISFDTLLELSGDHTALALYDIGNLRFLLLSDLNTKGQAALAYLEKLDSFDTRKIGERIFYTKEDPERGLSFAMYKSDKLLLVSNEIQLIEQSLWILENGPNEESFALNEDWTNGIKGQDDLLSSEMILYLDMARLLSDRYFRNYWIYRNRESLSDYKTVIAGIDVKKNGIHEKRVVLGSVPRDGVVSALKGVPFAWWSEAGPGKNPRKEISDYFGWKLMPKNEWKDSIRGRLLSLQAREDKYGIFHFIKGEVLYTDGGLNAKILAEEILNGSKSDLLIIPENFGFDISSDGVLKFERLKGMAGVYIKENDKRIFIANDPGLLKKLEKMTVLEIEKVEEASYLPMEQEFETWANAFNQMGPDAAFYMLDIGYFFGLEMPPLLRAAANYKNYTFRAVREPDGRLLQAVSYGE